MKKIIIPPIGMLAAATVTQAQQIIYPGSLSFDTTSVTHGNEFRTNRWAIDATGALLNDNSTGNTINYDYSATPTPYGNWSMGAPAQGPGSFFESTFLAGDLTNVVNASGSIISLVDGNAYQLRFAIKPTEFSVDGGANTWAIGQGEDFSVDWNYAGSTANSLVTLAADTWKEVFFDFTYQTGNNFILASQSLNGGTPGVTRLSGTTGATPPLNLEAPTIQVASPNVIPEPSTSMLGGLVLLTLIGRRRR